MPRTCTPGARTTPRVPHQLRVLCDSLVMTKHAYRAVVFMDPRETRDSLHLALCDIAHAWRCPFEALSTEQQNAALWFVLGPEGQHCGEIELVEVEQ